MYSMSVCASDWPKACPPLVLLNAKWLHGWMILHCLIHYKREIETENIRNGWGWKRQRGLLICPLSQVPRKRKFAFWVQSTAMQAWTVHQIQGLIISFALLRIASRMACHVKKSSNKRTWSGIKHMMMRVAMEWAILLTKQALARKRWRVTPEQRCKQSFHLCGKQDFSEVPLKDVDVNSNYVLCSEFDSEINFFFFCCYLIPTYQ